MLGFRGAIESTKGWSARVDRANHKVMAEIDKLVSSFDYLLASASRGREIIEEKLQILNEVRPPQPPALRQLQ